jgi:hypothetical protein
MGGSTMLENLRSELNSCIANLGQADFTNLTDPLIVEKSQELDLEIVKAMRKQVKSS